MIFHSKPSGRPNGRPGGRILRAHRLWKRGLGKRGLGKRGVGLFRKDEAGATAVEFAIVGPVFFAMTMFTMELGLGFVANKTLEFNVDTMSREIRTGQTKVRPVNPSLLEALENADSEEERDAAKAAIAADEAAAVQEAKELFRETLCAKPGMDIFFTCKDLLIDVQQISTWAERPEDPSRTTETDEDGNETPSGLDPNDFDFSLGGRQSINVVRVFYEWPTIMKFNDPQSRAWVDGKRMMMATSAFLSEPY